MEVVSTPPPGLLSYHKLIWNSLSPHYRLFSTPLWEILFFLLNQIRLLGRHWHFRNWFPHLRCCAKQQCLNYRPCHRWYWQRRNLLWRLDHHRLLSSSAKTSYLLLHDWSHVRYCQCCRSSSRWCFHRQSDLEMVFLHQPSSRSYYPHCHFLLLHCSSPCGIRTRHLETTHGAARYSRHGRIHALHYLSASRSTMGWIQIPMGRR